MAKRRTSRPVEEDEEDDAGEGEDGYAWDSPPKKSSSGKKKTSSLSGSGKKKTSARKSARSSSSGSPAKKGSARTGKPSSSGSTRSKASGRRSGSARASAEAGASGRKRRAAPPAKKNDNTVLFVSMISISIILVVGAVVVKNVKSEPVQVNHQSDLDAARALLTQGKAKFGEYNKAKNAGQASQALFQEALTSLQAGVDKMGQVLQQPQYVDAEGFTRPEYEGYETEMSEAAQLIIDLEKSGSLH